MENGLLPVEEIYRKKMRKKKRGFLHGTSTQQRIILIVLMGLIVLLITLFIAFFVIGRRQEREEAAALLAQEEARRQEQAEQIAAFEALTGSEHFLEGVTVDGVSIGGMTMSEAKNALASHIQSCAPSGMLQLTFEDEIYAFDLGLITASCDLDAVLASASQLGKTGDYATALKEAEDVKLNGRAFSLTASYDFSPVAARVSEIALSINKAAQNASVYIESGDVRSIGYTDPVPGVTVLEEELASAITDAISSGSTAAIPIPVLQVEPSVTKEMLAASYKLRGAADTSFSGSESNRVYNIKKGVELMNGTVLKPGEVFSSNDKLGVRTYSNGWKEANAYVSGATDRQAGGGVCQLSSTLYNAAVKADLEIVERRNHSMPVSYVSKGLDATINSVGNIIDFKFKNNTGSDIVIFCYTESKRVYFEIYGVPFDTTEYDQIKLSSKKIETLEPDTELVQVLDETLPAGASEVVVARQNGSIYQSYKEYYLNGTLVRSEKLALSTYKAFAGEMRVGPSPTLGPVITPPPATPTPEPSPTPIIAPVTP